MVIAYVGPIDAAWLVVGIIIVLVLNARTPKTLAERNRLFAQDAVKAETT